MLPDLAACLPRLTPTCKPTTKAFSQHGPLFVFATPWTAACLLLGPTVLGQDWTGTGGTSTMPVCLPNTLLLPYHHACPDTTVAAFGTLPQTFGLDGDGQDGHLQTGTGWFMPSSCPCPAFPLPLPVVACPACHRDLPYLAVADPLAVA